MKTSYLENAVAKQSLGEASTGKNSDIRLRRILVPTDFSEASKQVLPYAVALARQFGAETTMVYVVPTAWPAELSEMGILIEENRLFSEALTTLRQFREREFPPDLKAETLVLAGRPYEKLCEAARTMGTDLIITATHGHTGLAHLLMGSTAERIVRFAPCPVLTVRAQFIRVRFPETGPFSFSRIIVPVDFSEPSRQALLYAASLAKKLRAAIQLVHVLEPSPYYEFDRAQSGTMETQWKKTARAKLDLLLQSCAVDATAQVRIGVAFEEIVQEAANHQADLIILSTHGRTGLKHAFLGSTAERVVRHAACPVLVVRQHGNKVEFLQG